MTLSERKTLMKHSPSSPRRALKAALALGATAVVSLALAGVASADVIIATPDVGGSDHFTAAINQANTNGAPSNTIMLEPGQYLPAHQPITISKNLTISGDHSFQTPEGSGDGAYEVNGSAAVNAGQDNFLVVNTGVTLRLDGFNLDVGGAPSFAAVQVNGTLNTWGMMIAGNPGYAVETGPIGTANLTDTTIWANLNNMVRNNGQLNTKNVSILGGGGGANAIENIGTWTAVNTVIAGNQSSLGGPMQCNGAPPANAPAPGSITDAGSNCGFQINNDPNIDNFVPFGDDNNGGPETTVDLTADAPTHNLGVNCPTTDARFFLNPPNGSGGRSCDSGSLTDGATQQTTAPTCQITSTAADHSSQTVTVGDSASGIGPQTEPVTNNPTNTIATAYPPPAPVSVFGYAVDNAQISNGTIAAFNPPAQPSNNGVTITASKTTAGTPTQWSFTGLNWAGISKNCF